MGTAAAAGEGWGQEGQRQWGRQVRWVWKRGVPPSESPPVSEGVCGETEGTQGCPQTSHQQVESLIGPKGRYWAFLLSMCIEGWV